MADEHLTDATGNQKGGMITIMMVIMKTRWDE